MIEPEAKNTAPSILSASIFAHSTDRSYITCCSFGSLIPGVKDFHRAIKVGLSKVQSGKIVTFGIKPTHPETGYGYLELSPDIPDQSGTSNLKSFVEKPNLLHAEQMVAEGNFLWNSGIFIPCQRHD